MVVYRWDCMCAREGSVCAMFMWLCPQTEAKEKSLSADDGDDSSSFGIGHSSDGPMETVDLQAAVSGEEDMRTVIAAIAALSRGQAMVVDKLTQLEKVQIDVQFICDDMKFVHEDIERVFDQVCDIRDAAAESGRVKEDVSADASPPEPWNGNGNDLDPPMALSVSTTFGDTAGYDDDVPYGTPGSMTVESTLSKHNRTRPIQTLQ